MRFIERWPSGMPSGDADAPGGWLPTLTFNGQHTHDQSQTRCDDWEAVLPELPSFRSAIRCRFFVWNSRSSA